MLGPSGLTDRPVGRVLAARLIPVPSARSGRAMSACFRRVDSSPRPPLPV